MRECTEQEFNDFVSERNLKHIRVSSSGVPLDVYYDEAVYDPKKRDAYRSVDRHPNKFYIAG